MARPIKNNADYFPHDADMRNDPRVKALRRKFKLEGYAIYNLILEYLTDAEFFEVKVDKLGIELMAGDFDCSTEILESVLNYAIDLGLIQSDNSILSCKSLDNRLEPLLSKRKRDREVVIADDNTQSKVKESKGEKKKEEESTIDENFKIWTKDIFEGNDSDFEQMLMKEKITLSAENFDFLCKDHLDLLSRYPKMQPNSQQKFRNSLMKHIRENYQKVNGHGKTNGIGKKQQHNIDLAKATLNEYSDVFGKQPNG